MNWEFCDSDKIRLTWRGNRFQISECGHCEEVQVDDITLALTNLAELFGALVAKGLQEIANNEAKTVGRPKP